jgi:23S rRNA (cytidine1920-2'-O)/16S rRNA (cytidine1409-2'-O)-methyltransferase
MARARFRGLLAHLAAIRPDLDDPGQAISDGRVLVDGAIIDNPNARVRMDSAVVVRTAMPLRGEAKLSPALREFGVAVAGRTALDAGAAAGGFTRVLLDAGAARVYAVDAGHGQLLGSLRQDPRVVNLEATNLGDLSPASVPDAIDVVTLDLSYLSLAKAVPQLERIVIADAADLVALVKPMFELSLDSPPTDQGRLDESVRRAVDAIGADQWAVEGSMRSPVLGANGAVEYFIHARRRPSPAR